MWTIPTIQQRFRLLPLTKMAGGGDTLMVAVVVVVVLDMVAAHPTTGLLHGEATENANGEEDDGLRRGRG